MARTRHNSPEGDDADDGANPIFTIANRPVFFYLYGTNEPTEAGALTPGQRKTLEGQIKVRVKTMLQVVTRRLTTCSNTAVTYASPRQTRTRS